MGWSVSAPGGRPHGTSASFARCRAKAVGFPATVGTRKLTRSINKDVLNSDEALAVDWLASDKADHVTETALFGDEGLALYPGFRVSG